jgi:hypothetical protein
MRFVKHLILPLSLMVSVCGNSFGDTITVDGKTYNEVLIYKSSSKYYVKIPKTGKTMSVSIDEVASDAVEINDDPYYRDKLKAMYEFAKKMGKSDTEEVDPTFKVVGSAPQQGTVDTSSLFGGGGGKGKGLGVSQDQVKKALAQMQLTFTGSGNNITGKSADGSLNISIKGPANNVTSVTGSITGNPAALQAKVLPLGMFIGTTVPWAGPWLQQSFGQLQSAGQISKTQGGITIKMGGSGTEQSVTINFSMTS